VQRGDFYRGRLFQFFAIPNGFASRIREEAKKSSGNKSRWSGVVTNIFVGNLDRNATEEQLRMLFAVYGTVETVTIVKDRDTFEPRGFAFIEMTQAEQAQAAISSLNSKLLNERPMRVNEARPKRHRDPARDLGSRDHRHHQI
jgi:cold-inducible RNA-binding protein